MIGRIAAGGTSPSIHHHPPDCLFVFTVLATLFLPVLKMLVG